MGDEVDAARLRLAAAQSALLSALVDNGPPPAGFDAERLAIQREALAAKRAGVLARVAPELPRVLGEEYRPAALRYARAHPLTGGYRQDALAFVRLLLAEGGLPPERAGLLDAWLRARSEPPASPSGPLSRLRRAVRARRWKR